MDEFYYNRLLNDPSMFSNPEKAQWIEVGYEDSSAQYFDSGSLCHDEISAWLLGQRNFMSPDARRPVMRLLCVQTEINICPADGIDPETGLPRPCNEATSVPFPLSRSSFEEAMEVFQLHRSYLQVFSHRTAMYTKSTSFHHCAEDRSGSEAPESDPTACTITTRPKQVFTYIFQTSANSGAFFSLAISYWPQQGIQLGILCGLREKEIQSLAERLRLIRLHQAPPLFLPIVLIQMRIDYITSRIDESQKSLAEIKYALDFDESLTMPRRTLRLNEDHVDFGGDLTAVSRAVMRAWSTVAHCEYACEVHLPMIRYLQEASEALLDAKVTESLPNRKDRLATLRSKIQVMECWFIGTKARAVYLTQRSQGYAQAIFSIIAQKDSSASIHMASSSLTIAEDSHYIAQATQRDSTAMRTIAAVTIFFLPGTFTATLFSTTFFDFQAVSWKDVVSNRLWLFWIVTVSLTVGVHGGWYLYYRRCPPLERKRPPSIDPALLSVAFPASIPHAPSMQKTLE